MRGVTFHWYAAKVAGVVIAIVGVCLTQGLIPPAYVPLATAIMGLLGGIPMNLPKATGKVE